MSDQNGITNHVIVDLMIKEASYNLYNKEQG